MKQKYELVFLWHDQPEGGTFGTTVQATSHEEATQLALCEMADTYAEENEDFLDDFCRICGTHYKDGGDGYDGMCGDCADHADQPETKEMEREDDWGVKIGSHMNWREIECVAITEGYPEVVELLKAAAQIPALSKQVEAVCNSWMIDVPEEAPFPEELGQSIGVYGSEEDFLERYMDSVEIDDIDGLISDEQEVDLRKTIQAAAEAWQIKHGIAL